MPSRPRIGITPNYRTKDVDQGIPRVDLSSNYTRAVAAAGGLPIVLVPLTGDGHAGHCADAIDGLLLTGGPDIDPRRYGQEPHETINPLAAEREEFDRAIFEAVRAKGKPILGICLGHQEINVALGGSLHQHLPDAVRPQLIEHRWVDRDGPLPTHEVAVLPGTRLAAIMQGERLITNSSHHQGVDRIAPGLRASAFAEDGVLEALESEDGDQILSVQWHPEYMTGERAHLALFEDLVARARRCAG